MPRLYRIEKPFPAEEMSDGVRVGLGYADRPTQFSVTGDEQERSLLLEFQYASDTQEARESFESGRVGLLFVRHSKRLFAVHLRCPEMFEQTTAEAAAKALVDELRQAFEKLKNRTTTAARFRSVTAQLWRLARRA